MNIITPQSLLRKSILLERGFRLVTTDPYPLYALDIERKQYKSSTIYLTEHEYVAYNCRLFYYTAFRINTYVKHPVDVVFYDDYELRNVHNLNQFHQYLKQMAGF